MYEPYTASNFTHYPPTYRYSNHKYNLQMLGSTSDSNSKVRFNERVCRSRINSTLAFTNNTLTFHHIAYWLSLFMIQCVHTPHCLWTLLWLLLLLPLSLLNRPLLHMHLYWLWTCPCCCCGGHWVDGKAYLIGWAWMGGRACCCCGYWFLPAPPRFCEQSLTTWSIKPHPKHALSLLLHWLESWFLPQCIHAVAFWELRPVLNFLPCDFCCELLLEGVKFRLGSCRRTF